MDVALAMGYNGDFVAQPRRPQVVWTADMRATAYIVCTSVADADPFALRTAIFNKVCGSLLTKDGALTEVGWQAIKQQYCTRTTDARQKALWAEAMAILVDERGVDLRQRVTDVADDMGYVSGARPKRAFTRRLRWTDEMKAAAYLIDNEIEDSPPFDLHTRIFNTMSGAQLSARGFPDGIVYSAIMKQLGRRGKATAPTQNWENAMAVVDSDGGAKLLQMAKQIAGLDQPSEVVHGAVDDAPEGYMPFDTEASAADAENMLDGTTYISDDTEPLRSRRKAGSPRMKWTTEMRTTAYLISIHIEDSQPYSLRTTVFNAMYGKYLAKCGFPDGVEYGLIQDQLYTRTRKEGKGRPIDAKQSWSAAMAVAGSPRGVELLQQAKELAGINTPGEVERETVRAAADNAPDGHVAFGTEPLVATPDDVVYPDEEEDTLEATAALRAALDLPSGTTLSYANFEDVLGLDADKLAESVDSWLAAVRAGRER
ncbi:hypothetical protein LTR10_005474 [Elasticomyces elasticus]|nr:hypothetical protein LTR10_005474 [Elasticomyces elasticus]KAK4976212.1 hypothetical protein LTR42_003839 [Elasticomyces elasticus]